MPAQERGLYQFSVRTAPSCALTQNSCTRELLKYEQKSYSKGSFSQMWQCMSVIPALREAEAGGLQVQAKREQISNTLSQN